MSGTIVQSVAASANGATGVTATVSGTTSTNTLLIACQCSNQTQVLSVTYGGTGQSETAIGNPNVFGAGQLKAWYAKNIASGTTSVTVSRASGTGQFSLTVTEVSGENTTAPLDKSATSTTLGDSGTTATTTSANEFWWAIFGSVGPGDASVPTFTGLSAGWAANQTSVSAATGANNNTGIFDATRVVTSTGTANATITQGNTNIATATNLAATFIDGAGGAAQDTPELRGRPYGLIGQNQMQQLLAS